MGQKYTFGNEEDQYRRWQIISHVAYNRKSEFLIHDGDECHDGYEDLYGRHAEEPRLYQ